MRISLTLRINEPMNALKMSQVLTWLIQFDEKEINEGLCCCYLDSRMIINIVVGI